LRDYFYIAPGHPQETTDPETALVGILIYNNEKLIESVKEKLQAGETLREKLRELSEDYAEKLDIKAENLASILMCVRQTLDEMGLYPVGAIRSGSDWQFK